MRHSGWGAALDTRTRCEEPLGGQLEAWTTFTYYEGSRNGLADCYLGITIRCDVVKSGVFCVSACRRTWLTKCLERWTNGFVYYAGKRDLLEIHVRKT